MSGEVTDGWRLTGALSYLDAEVTEDNDIEEGNELPNAPDISGNLWSVYELRSGALSGLSLGGGVTYVGDRAGDINNTFSVDSYERVDLFAAYDFSPDLRLKVNANNIFDEDFIKATSSRTEIVPGAPAQVFARLQYDF